MTPAPGGTDLTHPGNDLHQTVPLPPERKLASATASAPVVIAPSTAAAVFGRVRLDGTPPPEKPLPLDPACRASFDSFNPGQPPKTRFYVGADGGLADVLVVIRGEHAPVKDPGRPPLLIDQRGCEYLPYVSACRVGGTITVRNSDPVLHNVHATPAVEGNPERNLAQLPRGPDLSFVFHHAEEFLRFKCDVHPWMFAYVSVLDHPHFAVTDARGFFRISKPPPGRYVIEAVHRKAGSARQEVEVSATGGVRLDFTLAVPAD